MPLTLRSIANKNQLTTKQLLILPAPGFFFRFALRDINLLDQF